MGCLTVLSSHGNPLVSCVTVAVRAVPSVTDSWISLIRQVKVCEGVGA